MTLRIGALRVTVELETSWSEGWVVATVASCLSAPVLGVVLAFVL
jgi:hypothetical protein